MIDWRSILQERETETHFIVEGQIPVERLQNSSYSIDKIIRIGNDLSREEASFLLGFHFHRGYLAIARKPENPPLSEMTKGTLVVLPEIADPGNLGTIIRNTAALGGAGVLLGKGASPFNAKAIRASAGNLFHLPVRRAPNLLSDLTEISKTHTILGTSLSQNSIPINNLPLIPNKTALLLGPEDFGLNQTIESHCDHLIHIPMSRGTDSLNVASASAIFLHKIQQHLL
ncbi:MAG: RNA methyltransferase [Akkermansiaceae bacterium]|jgi:tRNA G18 (ribose-2'-O)-methylase SpoU|nr:RNA methyltransferase [Akkermansiaceae bacterium]